MGIRTHIDVPFETVVSDGTPDLVGQITVEVYDPSDGTAIVAATTTGITQPRPGTYRAAPTVHVIGKFMVRWVEPDIGDVPGRVAEEQLQVLPANVPLEEDGIRPDLGEVGALLRARTRSDSTGTEIGTFNSSTRPTGTEVDDYIEQALVEVSLRLPTPVPDAYLNFARRMVALRAAMMVELSYDPDRTGDGSAYARLQEQFDSGMAALLDTLADHDQGVTRRITSLSAVSPTLAPFSDEVIEQIAPDPWPWP